MNRLSKNTTIWFLAACFTAVALPILASVTIDASFAHLYPDPWWKSWWGRMAIGVGIAVVTAAALALTVATAGTGGAMLGAAGSWITGVGSMVGMAAGYGSGAAAAGLAILGGGTLAAGGFGIAGGVFVVSALTGVATGVVTDLAVSQIGDMIAKEPYRRYEFVKVPLLEKRGSQNVRTLVSELRELEEKLNKKDITPQYFSKETRRVSSKLKDMLANACKDLGSDKDKLYDAINAAILYFNNGDYDNTKRCLKKVYPHTKNPSFLSYLYALNELSENNYPKAFKELDSAIQLEPKAVQPYILYTMALKDQGKYGEVLMIANDGLKEVGKDNFHLLYTAGEASFQLKRYTDAARYFEKAYDNVSEDIIEADTAMMVAVSYLKAGDKKKAWKWYEKALNELGDKYEKAKLEITKRWKDLLLGAQL